MTDKTARNFLKALAAFAIAASFVSASSLAGEFTVEQGKRYRATLSLKSVERLADNELIARKFRALGFAQSARFRFGRDAPKVEGVWPGKDASAPSARPDRRRRQNVTSGRRRVRAVVSVPKSYRRSGHLAL